MHYKSSLGHSLEDNSAILADRFTRNFKKNVKVYWHIKSHCFTIDRIMQVQKLGKTRKKKRTADYYV